MILLLGGTKETGCIAQGLAEAGYEVLVSQASDIPLDIGSHPRIRRRRGELDEGRLAALIREREIKAIVDSTHPYARIIRASARRVAERASILYLTLIRPSGIANTDGILWAADHEESARIAFSLGAPVLLTIGSRNLSPYAEESRRTKIPVTVRVLPYADSLRACEAEGFPQERVIPGRGPFSVEENRTVLRKYRIGVLVTKDSGHAGGAPEKMEAARLEGCRVVAIRRPDYGFGGVFDNPEDLVNAVKSRIPLVPPSSVLPSFRRKPESS
jgi:precorrin-6A/cobalt-precorrin-6A reductase